MEPKPELSDLIQHHGIKGMHWGVRNNSRKPDSAIKPSARALRVRSKLGQHLDSLKRERQWHSVLKQVHNMSTKDIHAATRRIVLENNLKRLSKSKMATSKDKQDYLRRHTMTDQELTRKVARLQAKDSLHKAVKDASKEQRDLGIKVARVGGSLGVKYALNKKITPKDVYDTIKKPKDSADKAKQDAMKAILERARKTKLSNHTKA